MKDNYLRPRFGSEIQQLLQRQAQFQDPALGNSYWEQIDKLQMKADALDQHLAEMKG